MIKIRVKAEKDPEVEERLARLFGVTVNGAIYQLLNEKLRFQNNEEYKRYTGIDLQRIVDDISFNENDTAKYSVDQFFAVCKS